MISWSDMDPFVATIIKKSALVVGSFAAAGLLAAVIYGLYQYTQLQHALTLNMVPQQLS
jgi:hypothetical protein